MRNTEQCVEVQPTRYHRVLPEDWHEGWRLECPPHVHTPPSTNTGQGIDEKNKSLKFQVVFRNTTLSESESNCLNMA